jgi:hypothetical protein
MASTANYGRCEEIGAEQEGLPRAAAAAEENEAGVRDKVPEQRRTTAGSQEREQLAGRGQEHEQVAWENDGDGKRRCGEGEDKVGPRDTCWMEEAEERRADPPGVRQRFPFR